MKRGSRKIFSVVVVGAAVASCVGWAVANAVAKGARRQEEAAVVTSRVYVSLEPVPRGREFQIGVVAAIGSEYHINSHKPTDPYLIPTTLTPEMPKDFELLGTIYPNGRLEKFSFSPDKPLNVYSGSVTLRLAVRAKTSAELGETAIPMMLRYQACNQTTCLPPVTLPLEAKFQAVPEGTAAREVHTEIFAALRNLR